MVWGDGKYFERIRRLYRGRREGRPHPMGLKYNNKEMKIMVKRKERGLNLKCGAKYPRESKTHMAAISGKNSIFLDVPFGIVRIQYYFMTSA